MKPLLRPIHYFIPKPPWRRRYSHTQPDPSPTAHDLLTILNKSDGAESLISHLSNNKLISLIQEHHTNPQLGFRLFIWATQRSKLCARMCRSAVIDMLLGDDNGVELYWRTLEEFRDCGIRIGCDAFSVLIRGYDKLGIAEKAVEAFSRMKDFDCKPDVYTYNAVLYVLVRKEVFLLALAVYNQMLKCNLSPSRTTYSILINGFCKSRKTQDAIQMFDEMTQRGIAPNTVTYTIIISGLCKAKRAHDAHRLVDTMKETGCTPDVITYHALLDGYCKLGRLDEAYALVRLLERDGYVLGVEGYSSLILGLFRARRFDEAHELYGKLIDEGIELDVILCTILIKGLADAGRVTDALNFLSEMSKKGLVPDAYCYNAVIKGFCDLGFLDEARSLHLEISKQDCFPNACTYTILICGMCRNGLIGEAAQIFNEMEKLGCVPSVVTFNALIDGLCKASKLEDAQLLFYKMEIGKKPSLFLRLSQGSDRVIDSASLQKKVEQLCESGLILQAYKLLMQLASSGVAPDVITYNTLINGFCKNGNIDGAFKLFKDMQLKGIAPDSVTYGTLIDGLQRVEREEDAFVVFNQMVKNGCTPSSEVYKSLMTWSCRYSKVSVAVSLWLKYLSSLPHREEEAIKAIEENFKEGQIEKAIQGLLEMDVKFKDLDLGPYTILLIGLCQVQRVGEALRMFSVLQEYKVNVTPPSCVHLINGLCKEGNLDLAINVFHYTLERGFMLMPEICNKLLKCLLRSRDKKDRAFDLIRRMRNFGYDLDACLHQTTKLLLQFH
ncbi:putative tetratricopeptide-like helical domain-containing protein [Rosa chinensis]|uniref:Putative tetratricopeptide-like helical domain-containing protein n=1 Tax=Rosa chinensis TaxID=74649 RepID=A0A2P6Q7X5_ROSCH|nr:pentatricopeptide repeat-containing protein At1g79540 [Rosa chinensis]PRQ30281.1 putative tetratricopeptide-like helical domain-containing protein [Rosa chinensis]